VVGKQAIKITHEDKILFPKSKIIKNDIIQYYARIADIMIPYVKNRPIMMHRFPKGINHKGFFQKNISDYFPKWIKEAPVERQDEELVHYALINNPQTLVYLANQGCITPHIWLSKVDKLNYPDKMIFDLDPSGKSFDQVRSGAKKMKKLFELLDLKTYVMTTGSRGLHVVIPLKRVHTFDYVRAFAKDISSILVKQYPKLFTNEIRKEKRCKKIFIDIYRNSFAQTSVAPYAIRAKERAPIATPIDWGEVTSTLTPTKYTIKNIFKRLSRKEDPWKDMFNFSCDLKKAKKIVKSMM